ncbi:hypothetical protein HHI36_005869 [Cryptolaemus montrouzieri]|uniref:Tudor domain-containing protein n=1 Tax=Cryptolaemus montrouzieri TaxID=559131 RepID=A0ABD2NWW3_9CUCU
MVLENIFHCQQESSYDFRLYDRNKPISTIKHTNEYPSGSSLNTSINDTLDPFAIEITNSVDWDQFTNLVPKDALRLGEKVENDLLDKFNINDRIQIVVSEICDPGRFWIYKDDGLLDDMMNSMQPFYREHKPYYLIPEILFEVGLYCVVHLNEFQRGLIVDLLPNIGGHVKVYFIDYGTMVILPKEKIWFLTREFSVLPAQAVKAKLANIKPIEQIWTMESSQRFREFVDSKHVFAKITGSEQNTLSMYIADNAKPLKFVNDVLVEEKHANYLNKEASSSGRTEKIEHYLN